MPHNHPPRCCCENTIGKQPDGTRIIDPDQICPSCVVHGELAQPECDSCHTPWGRPHTDYCKAVAPAEYPGQPDHCTFPNTTVPRSLLDAHLPSAISVALNELEQRTKVHYGVSHQPGPWCPNPCAYHGSPDR